MRYENLKNKIIIYNPIDFNAQQILDCGQIFRYKIDGNIAHVYSLDKYAKVTTHKGKVVIEAEDVDYFEHFFDLKTDYSQIKAKLKKDAFLLSAVDYGYGIRILNNDTFEMIVSFMISQNNNIPRIKKSIEFLCEKFGTKHNGYNAFPTIEQLKTATEQDYIEAGLGYRAKYMFETMQFLTEDIIDDLKNKSKDEQFKFLVNLKGIGEKVANCIMLFGLQRKDVFPVDTWINKVYNELTQTTETNRNKITVELTKRYQDLSGYAQQYFFYYFRENSPNK